MSRVLPEEDELEEDKTEVETVFKSYLEQHHLGGIRIILLASSSTDHYTLNINAMEFFDTNMYIGQFLLKRPTHFIPVFEEALRKAQASLMESIELNAVSSQASIKQNVHVRFSNLPVCPELTRINVPKSEDVGTFISFSGTVIRTSLAKLLEHEKEYMCNKCRHVFTVQADFSQHFTLCGPTACPSEEGCNSYKFTCNGEKDADSSNFKDYQEIKIQEQAQKLSVGTIPRAISVVLEDDLVDLCKPGDDVTVYGVVLRRWKPTFNDAKIDIEIVIRANNLIVNNDHSSTVSLTDEIKREFDDFWEVHKSNPLSGRNKIIVSICPQVFGLYVVKLAVALTLIGGIQRVSKTGTRVRGESHMLLVGDPGTGKSQFLKFAVKLMPRSVLTTGIGTTSAGLTVTAVRDSGEWQLEAGALVLADGGLCCIDEFNCIREHDKASIHEAMEQQTVSVAKAGLVCKLNTRATILAATNPKGSYDSDAPLDVNVGLASPLLSRFDIVLVLLDNRNEEWDRIISSFVLDGARPGSEPLKAKKEIWTIDRMQTYFCYVRTKTPVLSEDASRILTSYYAAQRSADLRNAARTTLRLLESLVRIAQAHARLLYRDQVTVQDAVVAICIMESSMQSAGIFGSGLNPLHTSFPKDPDAEYLNQAQVVLTGLKLHDILKRVREWEEERTRRLAYPSCVNPNEDDLRRRDNTENAISNEFATSQKSDPVDFAPLHCFQSTSDSNRETDSELQRLLSHSEIYNIPVAISVDTSSEEEKSGRIDKSQYTRLSGINRASSSVVQSLNATVKSTEVAEANRIKFFNKNKSEDFNSYFDSNIEERSYGNSKLVPHSPEAKDEDEPPESCQMILHSNINHYPNIFELDDEENDETIDEPWPFSFHQDDPTQIRITVKRKDPQCSYVESDAKQMKFSSSPSNDTELGLKDSNCSMLANAQTLSEQSSFRKSAAEKLKKFKFRKNVLSSQN